LYDCPGNVFVAGFIGIPAMNFFSGTVVDRGEELFFVEELQGPVTSSYGMSLRIEQTFHKGLLDYLGRKIILGIRPERILDEFKMGDDSRERVVAAIVEMIECLGAETYLRLTHAGSSLVARSTIASVNAGQKIPLFFNMRRAHFFDSVTTKAIPCAPR